MGNLKVRIGGILLLACLFGAAEAATPPGCKRDQLKCHVDVQVKTGGTCTDVNLDPPTVSVSKDDRDLTYRIIWMLPPDYEFRPAMGDGVVIKSDALGKPDDHGEFADAVVGDDDDGEPSGKPKGRRWRWKYLNTQDGRFDYKIQFRNKQTGKVYTCDPVITNLDAG